MEEAFSQAGLALFETMLDTKNVHLKTSEEIQTAGHDEKELLYNYLEELLLLFEVKQLALGDFTVSSITPTQVKSDSRAKQAESLTIARGIMGKWRSKE